MKNIATGYQFSKNQRGLSLLELLAVLAILAIITSTGLPSLNNLVQQKTSTNLSYRLLNLIQTARSAAVNHAQMTTLCPTTDFQVCAKNWHEGILLFLDSNENGRREENEKILFVNQALAQGSLLRWRAFRNKPYLQYTPEGFTNYQNGRFAYCPPSKEDKYKVQIIINQAGRPRIAATKELKNYC